ncbi:MAG: potassium-transporting ATPase subunit KdpC [Proteobacteria bacterium]|nr:potassium-transporting ATPase subunit KdpC [Pseudomonadota bacterium]
MPAILRPAIVLLLLMTALTGLAYPLLITAVAQVLFPSQAAGSVVLRGGRAVGSALIGQSFSDPGHFWGRPSATAPQPYNGTASGGSNLGPLNPALADAVKARIEALRTADPAGAVKVPVDLVTASSSGLDPEISLAAADFQAPRIAQARHTSVGAVTALIEAHARGRVLGFLGEPRVNVLELNLALDGSR